MLHRGIAATFVLIAAGIVAALAAEGAPPAVERYRSQATTALGLPFSDAVRVGDLIFVSGQVGNKPGTLELVPGGIAAEARQAIENIRSILERFRSSLDDAVKCTVFLADIKDWPAFNEVYRSFFKTNLPARSALGASGLAVGARVEIECIAVPRTGGVQTAAQDQD